MSNNFYVTVDDVIKELSLDILFAPCDPKSVKVASKNINRIGLELIGVVGDFDNTGILVMSDSENHYFSTLSSDKISQSVDAIFSLHPPALIVANNAKPHEQILNLAKKHGVIVLQAIDTAAVIVNELSSFLGIHLAPRITRSGDFVAVHGEGVLIIGESGIGKSELALELLKRGHKLIADDLVEIRKVPKNTLIGSSPENIRHFIEVRGIGIINARRIFGTGAVKLNETIDMVINLELWDDNKDYERTGTSHVFTEILGVQVPYVTLPVKPGRNLAIIVEIAAVNNRQRKMGYNAAKELFANLGMEYPQSDEIKIEKCIWDL